MLCFPNCKINLGLYIEEKRNDGFHNIRTVFFPIPITDILEIIKSDKFEFSTSGIKIDGDFNTNLCIKAYKLLKEDFDLTSVKIHLHKTIPIGAGLGGGSSDAAYTIITLNKIFELGLSENLMINYASKLGSDCAFFIKNIAVIASEKGNIFEDIHLDLSEYSILIVKPDIHINTKEAFQLIKPRNTIIDLKNTIESPVSEWKLNLTNDFEKEIFIRYPEIADIKNKMYDYGAIYASMSGSGSSVFGLFRQIPKQLEFPENYFIWKQETDN